MEISEFNVRTQLLGVDICVAPLARMRSFFMTGVCVFKRISHLTLSHP